MFLSFLALFLCSWGFLLVANKDVLEPDWRDFQKHSDVNRNELVNFIRKFPIQTYWDTLKGEYRTGALGENVKDITVPTHLSLLTWVDRQILQNGKVIKIKQPIVDQNLLFMLMLVVVQDISELSEHLLHVSGGYEAKYNFQSMTELIRGQNFTSTADSEAALKIAELEAKLVSLQRNVQERRIAFNLLSENEQTIWKQQARSSVHQKLLKQLEESTSRINMIYNQKWSKLQQSMENSAHSNFELEKLSIEKDFAESLQDLEEEIQTTFAIIRFRAEEEKKSFALIEESATRVAAAQMYSQQESVDEILTVLSTEIANMLQEIVRDPWFIWLWGRMILGIVIGTVFVIELSRSLHILFYHWQRKSKRLYSQQQVLPSWWRRILGSSSPIFSNPAQFQAKEARQLHISCGDHVVAAMEEESLMVFSRNVGQTITCPNRKKLDLSTCNRDRLLLITRELYVAVDVHARPYMNSYAAFVPFQATPLPNLLFCGPAGCGKSETAKLIAQYICQDKRSGHEKYSGYIVFSGADLLALGDQAGQYVRDLFQKYHNSTKSNSAQGKTTLLIIDEADEIICTRDKLPVSFLMNAKKSSSLVDGAPLVNVPPEEETPEANSIPSTHGSNGALDQSLINNGTWERQVYSNNTAPHHVLYSLLEGLRSPSTSLGVIFTTRLNVTQVDPAFLDRMDHVLIFPRPSPFDTLRYLLSHFLETIGEFSSHVEAIQTKIEMIKRDEQLQQQFLEPVLTGDVWKICRPLFLLDSSKDLNTSELFRDDVSVTSNFSESSSGSRRQSLRLMKRSVLTSQSNEPSNVRPTLSRIDTGNEENRNTFSSNKSVSPIQQFLSNHEKDLLNKANLQGTFAWESCLQMLILHACRLPLPSVETNSKKGKKNASTALESWSYRDFHKFLMNIRFATLCSDNCQVTTCMWLEELMRSG